MSHEQDDIPKAPTVCLIGTLLCLIPKNNMKLQGLQ